jgi:peptide deformylase
MSDLITFNTEENTVKVDGPKIFNLVHHNDPILRQVTPNFDFDNPPVNPNQFASILVETCKAHGGIGLSANQCGFPYRVFVVGSGDNFVAFYNPVIEYTSPETVHMAEGCLSFPFLGLKITRPQEVHISYQDFNGQFHEMAFTGITARCCLHELDHLNGVFYTDLVGPVALQMGKKKQSKFMKKMGIVEK